MCCRDSRTAFTSSLLPRSNRATLQFRFGCQVPVLEGQSVEQLLRAHVQDLKKHADCVLLAIQSGGFCQGSVDALL